MKLYRFLNRGNRLNDFASAAFCPDEQPVKIHNTVRIAKSILGVFSWQSPSFLLEYT